MQHRVARDIRVPSKREKTPDLLSASTIESLRAISKQSKSYAEQGAAISPSGEVLPDKPSGPSWVNVIDKGGRYQLLSAPSGNFHFAEAGNSGPGATFESNGGVLARDDQLQSFFYFPDTMERYGVSRWRHATLDRIPRGSCLATLVPVKGQGQERGTYVVSDTLGNYFFPIACTYDDGTTPTRLFLAKSVGAVAALKEPTMETLITGGAVKECGYFTLVSPGFAGF